MKYNKQFQTDVIILLLLIIPIIPIVSAITGQDATGTYTINGMTGSFASNGTGSFSIRGILTFISSQFQFPSIIDILYRGRFTILPSVNTAPGTPDLISPLNDSYLNTTSMDFSWNNVTEPENDTVSYTLEIFNDSALTLIHFVNSSILETNNPTSTIGAINPDGIYYWQIIANDSEFNSTSELRTVILDTILPTNFNLTSPINGTSTTDNTPTLEWETPLDANLENYTIELSTNSFTSITRTEYSTSNSLTGWSSPLSKGTYEWRVRATDKANNHKYSESAFYLTIEAVTEITQISQGTTSVAGGSSPKPYSFHIIAPPSITIYKDQSIVVPLTIENLGGSINLNNIKLSALVDQPGIRATLDRIFISNLKPLSNITVNLILTATEALEGTFSISILADIFKPRLTDSVKIITSITGEKDESQASAQQQLVFAKKFFDGNPECKDLKELLDQAEQELSIQNVQQAASTLTKAVSACRDLVAVKVSREKEVYEVALELILKNRQLAIILAESMGALIIILVIFNKFRKRNAKNLKLDF